MKRLLLSLPLAGAAAATDQVIDPLVLDLEVQALKEEIVRELDLT